MALEVSGDRVSYKCGCGKLTQSVQGWRGHMGAKLHAACDQPYTLVIEGIDQGGVAPSGPQRADSREPDTAPQTEIERPAQPPHTVPEPDSREPQDTDSQDAEAADSEAQTGRPGAAQDPIGTGSPAPEEWGGLRPSLIPERSVSYPSMARFAYDLYRARFPAYKSGFNDFVFDMFEFALFQIGLHPAGIWTEPGAPPPPNAVYPTYDPEAAAELIKEMAGAAA